MQQSPSKRRALAPLDANAITTSSTTSTPSKPTASAIGRSLDASPLKKRAIESAAAAAATAAASVPSPRPEKRLRVEQQQQQSRSYTPDPEGEGEEDGETTEEGDSSLFDNTVNNDASWASNTTPDASPAPRVLTREQAREKAEILRLRLGLASYKLRTGQTAVPLAELVVKKPLLGADRKKRTKQEAEEANSETGNGKGHGETGKSEEQQEEAAAGEQCILDTVAQSIEGKQSPAQSGGDKTNADGDADSSSRIQQGEEDTRLASISAGAASGLLSLARGGSAE